MRRKKNLAKIWNDLHPDHLSPGLIVLSTSAKGGGGNQYVACGGDDTDKLDKTARRIAALWNAAEELELTTAKIAEGEIQRTVRLAELRADVIEAALERIEKLEAEKAEMLAALEEMADMNLCTSKGLVAIRKARGEE